MNPQLARIQGELQEATRRVRQLMDPLSDAMWRRRPESGGWSVGHCVMHLNKSTEGFLPRLDAAIRAGWERNLIGGGPFRRDVAGWLLCRIVEPPYLVKMKTPAKFDPQEVDSAEHVIIDWERQQNELLQRIAYRQTIRIGDAKIRSAAACRQFSKFVVHR